MTFYNNKKHFLHKHLKPVLSLGIPGGQSGFENHLNKLGIRTVSAENSPIINWSSYSNSHKFNYDLDGNKDSISDWLIESSIAEHHFVITWIDYHDPIIKIPTIQFIKHWKKLNIACGWSGLVVTTEDGKLFLEFTDDSTTTLYSNFQIKTDLIQ